MKSGVSTIGRSLGSAMSIYISSKREIDKSILITPFDSIVSIAQDIYPYFPIPLLSKDPFYNTKYTPDINNSTLIILAQNDNLTPLNHAKVLIDSFKNIDPKVEIIKDEGHHTLPGSQELMDNIEKFMRSLSKQ